MKTLIQKYKTLLNKISPLSKDKNKWQIFLFFNENCADKIPLQDLMQLIENDVIYPTKIIHEVTKDNLFNSVYFRFPDSVQNKEVLNFLDLLIKKGVSINHTNKRSKLSILNKRNQHFLENNIGLLLKKYQLNIDIENFNKFIVLVYDSNINTFGETLSIFLNLIKTTQFLKNPKTLSSILTDEINLHYLNQIFFKILQIENRDLRLDLLNQMIDLKLVDINHNYYGENIYTYIKEFDDFLFLKEKGCTINENDFIFLFLLNNFEKNLPTVQSNLEQIYSNNSIKKNNFLENFLFSNQMLTDSQGRTYLNVLTSKISGKGNYILALKEGKAYVEDNNRKKIAKKLFNQLEYIKNNYNISYKKLDIINNNYIKSPEDLIVFIDYDFKINFYELKARNLNYEYNSIIKLQIPEKLYNNPSDFGALLSKTDIFEQFCQRNGESNILNNYKYLELYINKYGVRLNEEYIIDHLLKIKNKKCFDLIIKTHSTECKESFNLLIEREYYHEGVSIIFLQFALDFLKENFERKKLENYLFNNCFAYKTSYGRLKFAIDFIGEEKFRKMANANLSKFSNIETILKNKEIEYFTLLSGIGVIPYYNLNYFDDLIKINELRIDNITNFILKMEKIRDKSHGFFRSSRIGSVINILTKTPNKFCYLDISSLKKEQNDFIDLNSIIEKLKNKNIDFNINKCDDYGYTIVDYFFNNFIYNQLDKYHRFNFLEKNELLSILFNNKYFLENMIEFIKYGYIISDKLLEQINSIKDLYKERDNSIEYEWLISHIEKLSITNQLKLSKKKEENKLNIHKIINKANI